MIVKSVIKWILATFTFVIAELAGFIILFSAGFADDDGKHERLAENMLYMGPSIMALAFLCFFTFIVIHLSRQK